MHASTAAERIARSGVTNWPLLVRTPVSSDARVPRLYGAPSGNSARLVGTGLERLSVMSPMSVSQLSERFARGKRGV